MIMDGEAPRDLSRLMVPQSGSLDATGDLFEPYRLVDADGVVAAWAVAYFRELAAGGRAAATQRSYGMALLRWWRFLRAVEIGWDEATQAEARDFLCWVQLADKPERPHWRYPGGGAPGTTAAMAPGTPNPVTGKRSPGRGYATATVVHCESVLRAFYDFHLEAGTGPMVNPFPLARGRELLGATAGDADPGQQLITVIRKGTRALQQLPASPDAFVWLRLYQAEIRGLVPAGRDQPLWWTLRRPWRALGYDAARAMFARANAALGSNWSLHDLRHSAAYRLARDPGVPLTDVRWVMGHAHLSTTQQYLNPLTEDVIASVLAFH